MKMPTQTFEFGCLQTCSNSNASDDTLFLPSFRGDLTFLLDYLSTWCKIKTNKSKEFVEKYPHATLSSRE